MMSCAPRKERDSASAPGELRALVLSAGAPARNAVAVCPNAKADPARTADFIAIAEPGFR
eukprot:4962430-Amphidinium_carterae.1